LRKEERIVNNECIVKFPVTAELLEAACKAGQEGVEIWKGRPVTTIEMRAFMDCPLPPYYSEDEPEPVPKDE